jgi:hypothetical protein
MTTYTFDRIELARLLRQALNDYQEVEGELIDIGSPNRFEVVREMVILKTITELSLKEEASR